MKFWLETFKHYTTTVFEMEITVIDGTRQNPGMQNAISAGFLRFKIYLMDLFGRFFGVAPPIRDIPVTILFLGQRNVGKTTAAQYVCTSVIEPTHKAIHEDVFHKSHPKSSFTNWKYESRVNQINFVEVPSFESSGNHDYNAKVVTALNSFLKRESRAIPNLIFITASLTDSRLAGPASNFSNMLNCLKYQGNRLMTSKCSNFILCLTNMDKLEIQDTLKERKIAYETQFEEILGIKPLYVMLIGDKNTKDADNFAQNKLVLEYIGRLVECHKHTFQLKKIETEMKSLYADIPTSLTSKMLAYDYDGTVLFSEKENMAFVPDNLSFGIQAVEYENIALRSNSKGPDDGNSSDNLYNLVGARSKITLADGTNIPAAQCVRGDRVLGHLGVGVVTDVILNAGEKCEKGASNAAKIHVVVKQNNTSLYLYNDEKNRTFAMQNKLKEINCGTNRDASLVYLEVNGGTGTIIVDGYVRQCSAMRHLYHEMQNDDECLVTRL